MKNSILSLFLFVSAFGFSQDKPVDVPTITVKIPLGNIVHLENASVEFIEVLEDSRCPKDVTCVWEGRAKVLVRVVENGRDAVEMELLFGARKKNFLVTSEGYVIKAMSLSPYPTTSTVGKMDYVLLVSESVN